MKKIFRHLDASLVCSILFFCLMVTVGVATAHAQDTIRESNPLLYTTGPNVLGSGRIQWNSHVEYHHEGSTVGAYDYNSHSFGLATGFRFGIGSRAELTLDLEGQYCTFDNDHFHNTTGFNPSVGAKLLLSPKMPCQEFMHRQIRYLLYEPSGCSRSIEVMVR